MDRRYLALIVYAVCFGLLFAAALTPLMGGLLAIGLNDTLAALIGWFTVIFIPLAPAKLVKDM